MNGVIEGKVQFAAAAAMDGTGDAAPAISLRFLIDNALPPRCYERRRNEMGVQHLTDSRKSRRAVSNCLGSVDQISTNKNRSS